MLKNKVLEAIISAGEQKRRITHMCPCSRSVKATYWSAQPAALEGSARREKEKPEIAGDGDMLMP